MANELRSVRTYVVEFFVHFTILDAKSLADNGDDKEGIINSDSTSKIDDASGINVAGTSDRNSDVDQPDKSGKLRYKIANGVTP